MITRFYFMIGIISENIINEGNGCASWLSAYRLGSQYKGKKNMNTLDLQKCSLGYYLDVSKA